MNPQLPRKIIAAGIVAVLLMCGLVYYFSLEQLTVTYSNVNQATVYKVATANDSATKKLVATVKASGQTVRLRAGTYIVHFEATPDYAARDKVVVVNRSHLTVSYEPYYSDEKLGTLLPLELPLIKQLISQKYPESRQYEIQPGNLYHYGDWYGTTLVYQGSDYFNTDTLRLVAHKENGSWVIKTTPPSITLGRILFPDVPRDILSSVNSL